MDFSLTYSQLKDLYAHAEAHRDWKGPLKAVGGIYLILAETNGEQYVGSAYGVYGLWGRWRHYARTGHGGDKLLRKLLKRDRAYPDNLRFSILQILPKTLSHSDVIDREKFFKSKLGTRAHGLNAN